MQHHRQVAISLPDDHAKLVVQPREVEVLVEQGGEARDLGILLEADPPEDTLGALDGRQRVVGHQYDRHLALFGAVDHHRRGPDVARQHQRRGRSLQRGQLQVDPVAARVVATVRVGPESVRDGDDGNVRGMLLAGRRLWVYHLGADGGWALTPVDTSTGRTGPGLALPSLGMCELATDGTDVWFGSAPGDDMGVFRVDLRSRTVSRVRGLTHDETYALRLS